jgi:hypothetical protein
MSDETYAALEDALRAHVADETDENCVATDWYIVTAAQELTEQSTRYLHIGSSSPWHTLFGLISAAKRQLLRDDAEDLD